MSADSAKPNQILLRKIGQQPLREIGHHLLRKIGRVLLLKSNRLKILQFRISNVSADLFTYKKDQEMKIG
jgi:hypothetical protein